MVERTDLPIDQYTDRPLLGSTIDYGCFCPVTARNTEGKKKEGVQCVATLPRRYRSGASLASLPRRTPQMRSLSDIASSSSPHRLRRGEDVASSSSPRRLKEKTAFFSLS
ncbi:hypothetical protein BHM03_00054677 [Ensete ventricosum]|nr:hypothetical protein BHM03_00054677 [Ensete ventricosum]